MAVSEDMVTGLVMDDWAVRVSEAKRFAEALICHHSFIVWLWSVLSFWDNIIKAGTVQLPARFG